MDTNQHTPVRPFKRTSSGCLIIADYKTPASDQMYGYVLAPTNEPASVAAISERLYADLIEPMRMDTPPFV